jgi:signal peptidase II
MRFGLLISGVVIIADQLSKMAIVDWVFRPDGVTATPYATRQVVEILPFFQLRLTWNSGISFSLLNSGETVTVILLVAFQLCIVGVLIWWLRQAENRTVSLGIGFIVGGALGNIADRIRFGAVVDFLDFHAAGYHFPTFNLADSCITLGVGFWLLDAYLTRDHHTSAADPK